VINPKDKHFYFSTESKFLAINPTKWNRL